MKRGAQTCFGPPSPFSCPPPCRHHSCPLLLPPPLPPPPPQINDLGYEVVKDPASGALMYNVVVGGLFSIKRNMMSIPMDCAVSEEQLMPFTLALLRVFR